MSRPRKYHISKDIQTEQRIAELRFRQIILKYFGRDPNLSRLNTLIESWAYIFNLNQMRLKAAAIEAMHDDYNGIRKELAVAMTKQKLRITHICKVLGMGMPKYYEFMTEYWNGDFTLYPRYNKTHTIEIVKFMAHLDMFLDMSE